MVATGAVVIEVAGQRGGRVAVAGQQAIVVSVQRSVVQIVVWHLYRLGGNHCVRRTRVIGLHPRFVGSSETSRLARGSRSLRSR